MTQFRKELSAQATRYRDALPKFHSRPHDVQNLYVSLKQWRILHAVVDCGGYAEAAKVLHLSQSTISYTISKLQEQLGVVLLRVEGRKATLTSEGRALLDRSRHVLKEAVELETFAKNLGQGWGEEVQLVFDQNFPTHIMMQALSRFTALGRGAANVRLRELALLQAEDVLRDQKVDLAISERVPLGFLGEPLVEIEYMPVVRPDHPLLKLGREVSTGDLAQQVQIEIGQSGASGTYRQPNQRLMRRWTMSSFDTVVAAVCEGHGYAWLPTHRVHPWLEQGKLARIPVRDKAVRKSLLYLVHGHPWSATTAASRFAEVLREIAVEEVAARHATSDALPVSGARD